MSITRKDPRMFPRMFQGAKISLGPVNLADKGFKQYSTFELAYIIGRYMTHHAEGNVYKGTVTYAIKDLWPEADVSEKDMKVIYRILKVLGFRHDGRFGEDIWKISDSADDKYHEKAPKLSQPAPAPVIYSCAFCHEKFDTSAKLKLHLSGHREEGKMSVTKEKESQAVIDADNQIYRCRVCGKEMKFRGLGGHMNGHKLSKQMNILLDAVKTMQGLHPAEYAELLGKSASSTSGVAGQLKKRNLIKTTGGRATTRYFTKEFNLANAPKIPKTKSSNGKKRHAYAPKKQVQPNIADIAQNIGVGVAPVLREAYILVVGKQEFLIDGNNVRPL